MLRDEEGGILQPKQDYWDDGFHLGLNGLALLQKFWMEEFGLFTLKKCKSTE